MCIAPNCLCLQSSPRDCLVIIFERQCFFHRAPKSAYRRDPLRTSCTARFGIFGAETDYTSSLFLTAVGSTKEGPTFEASGPHTILPARDWSSSQQAVSVSSGTNGRRSCSYGAHGDAKLSDGPILSGLRRPVSTRKSQW